MSRGENTGSGARALNLSTIYRAYQEYVVRILQQHGLHGAVVDDAVQDVFLVVHRRIDDFDGRAPLRNWIYGIARRVASDYRRGTRRGSRQLVFASRVPETELVEHLGERIEAAQLIERVLAALAPHQRRVLLLAELEGMTAIEIAARENLNVNTVYSRLRVIRRHLEHVGLKHLSQTKPQKAAAR